MSPKTIPAESGGAVILSRVLNAHAQFDPIDIDWMNALAEKDRRGILTETEQQELQGYLRVGHLLDLLHSKARLALKQTVP